MRASGQGNPNILVYGIAAAIVVAAMLASALAWAAFVTVPQKDKQIRTLQDEREEALQRDADLLFDVLGKLAEISGDKAASTGLAVFAAIRDVFTAVSQISAPVSQYEFLCLDTQVQDLFAFNATIQLRYDESCSAYAVLVDSDAENIGDYQAAFNMLILALLKLDNAISADP